MHILSRLQALPYVSRPKFVGFAGNPKSYATFDQPANLSCRAMHSRLIDAYLIAIFSTRNKEKDYV